jgi:CRISPR-associated endonuclease/helicase Cas3
MADLQAVQFREFFEALHGRPPFPWQEALTAQVCGGEWPEVIHLPTASGKTACIDVALFALAVRGMEAARRIFFVVDRRVVVNEAYLRTLKVQGVLKDARNGVLHDVAERLRLLARGNSFKTEDSADSGNDPLFVYEMRGGAFRDESWVRNPLQPTVIVSTVDQVGSRLLFRGYGVNPNSWPLHAGLIGNDALIFLDEAHCSRPFAQTLKRVEKYRGPEWASHPIQSPFRFVEMTATPSQPTAPDRIFTLTQNDHNVDSLEKRLKAAKPTRMVEVKGKKDDTSNLVEGLIEQAIDLARTAEAKRVAIFANRVKTAKQVYKELQQRLKENHAQIELVIGSMRTVDRDDLYGRKLQHLKSDAQRGTNAPLTFVVSTQCLEVGADFDFDVLVSECASIDALQQRFGRLDRLGEFRRAQGAIMIGTWQINPKRPDAVYGEALSKTWEWLKNIAGESGTVNMGIESRAGEPQTVSEQLRAIEEHDPELMRLIGEDAPVLLPAHVDMLAQTSPVPEPSPLVELFLHGPKRNAPDVQVVWRSDLEFAQNESEESEIVKLCPPSSAETMPVSISAFRKWFAGENDIVDKESDLEAGIDEDAPEQQRNIYALAWSGEDGKRVFKVNEIKPGQTLILKESLGGWNDLGYVPDDAPIDVGDRAAFAVRKSVSLRLHTEIMKEWPKTPAVQALMERVSNPDVELDEVEDLLQKYRDEFKELPKQWPYEFLSRLDELDRIEINTYPQQQTPYVLRARIPQKNSKQAKNKQVFLEDHLTDVRRAVSKMTSGLENNLQDALKISAKFHDYGKADLRFQAWLRSGDLMAARFTPKPIAKSGNDGLQRQDTVGLPEGFRHELLSLMFAEKSAEVSGAMKDLVLHLIAAHHGRCRPFAPVVLDEGAQCVSYNGISICKEERFEKTPHRLDSGIADRFWRLTAKYGWWGLAYLEALLRLADWRASEQQAAEVSE